MWKRQRVGLPTGAHPCDLFSLYQNDGTHKREAGSRGGMLPGHLGDILVCFLLLLYTPTRSHLGRRAFMSFYNFRIPFHHLESSGKSSGQDSGCRTGSRDHGGVVMTGLRVIACLDCSAYGKRVIEIWTVVLSDVCSRDRREFADCCVAMKGFSDVGKRERHWEYQTPGSQFWLIS